MSGIVDRAANKHPGLKSLPTWRFVLAEGTECLSIKHVTESARENKMAEQEVWRDTDGVSLK